MRLKLKNLILIIFLILFNNASLFASDNKIQLNNVKTNVSKWMIKEWNKTVEFQKEEFNKMKSQLNNDKKEIKKIFNYIK
tara:strand:+ start:206 stop:445 length:240 start_codon:yes stop_codon:yes gene_type:complete